MSPVEIAIALLGSGTLGAILLQVANTIGKRITGAAPRERARNNTIEAQRIRALEERDKAYEERDESINKERKARDEADMKRRKTEEYASSLRRQLLENGLTPGEWPIELTRSPLNDTIRSIK